MPMWDNEPEHDSGPCARCGHHAEDGIVHWIPRMSTADVRLIIHADPEQCTPDPRPQKRRLPVSAPQ
jgi:hypothetical protein